MLNSKSMVLLPTTTYIVSEFATLLLLLSSIHAHVFYSQKNISYPSKLYIIALPFNLYFVNNFKESLTHTNVKLKVKGVIINNNIYSK